MYGTAKGGRKAKKQDEEQGGKERRNAAKASEAKEMRMENTVSGRSVVVRQQATDQPVEGRRLTYLPVVGSVGVCQVENLFVASLALLHFRNRAHKSTSRTSTSFLVCSSISQGNKRVFGNAVFVVHYYFANLL